jgi:hypothetical protein
MAKRYYNLEKETKEYLKACEAKGIVNQESIKVIDDYIKNRKSLGLSSTFLGETPVVLKDMVLWLDASVPDSFPAGGLVWRDLSGQSNNASLLNGPTFDQNSGGSIVFDGVNDTADVTSSNSLNFGTQPFTICFSTFRTAFGFQGGTFINKGTTTGVGWGTRDNGFIAFSSLGRFAQMTFTPTANVWRHHTVIVRQDQSPYLTYYRDGVLVASSSSGEVSANLGSVSNSTNLQIGSNPIGRFYTGRFPDCQIYSRILTPAEILQNFNATKWRYSL